MPIEDIQYLTVYGLGDSVLQCKVLIVFKIRLKEIVDELIEVPLLLLSDTEYNANVPLLLGTNIWKYCALYMEQSCSSLDHIC